MMGSLWAQLLEFCWKLRRLICWKRRRLRRRGCHLIKVCYACVILVGAKWGTVTAESFAIGYIYFSARVAAYILDSDLIWPAVARGTRVEDTGFVDDDAVAI